MPGAQEAVVALPDHAHRTPTVALLEARDAVLLHEAKPCSLLGMSERVLRWREVTPLEDFNGGVQSLLETVNTLRSAWQQAVDAASPTEFEEARKRTLRRHAIETGIIERLYDVDWGVTEALVAEGMTLDAAEKEGAISPNTLAMIRSQFDALEFLAEVARGRRSLTVQLIRELHLIITRHQPAYTATDQFGNQFDRELQHGEWKRWPNHVRRQDGSFMEYAPPEQVQQQIEILAELHGQMDRVHPVLRAAWLHHRFICVHPFEDGNGRVARALVLLDLLRDNCAPLVVDRTRRDEYIASLDAANEGDLSRLVRLFAELEIVALRSELHQPAEMPAGSAVNVARAYAERIRQAREVRHEERRRMADTLAGDLHTWLLERLPRFAAELEEAFKEVDSSARARVDSAVVASERSSWWRHQLIRAAREVNFWTNLTSGTWWVRLELRVMDRVLRYVVAIQAVGDRDVGVRAVTVFAEVPQPRAGPHEDGGFVPPIPLIRLSSTDSVTMVGGQSLGDIQSEVEGLVERTLASTVDEFGRQLT
jgi:Fic family protein